MLVCRCLFVYLEKQLCDSKFDVKIYDAIQALTKMHQGMNLQWTVTHGNHARITHVTVPIYVKEWMLFY